VNDKPISNGPVCATAEYLREQIVLAEEGFGQEPPPDRQRMRPQRDVLARHFSELVQMLRDAETFNDPRRLDWVLAEAGRAVAAYRELL
jgi:hypothetical protein